MTELATTDALTRPAALDQDYTISAGYWWYGREKSRGLALPWAIDDITADFGDDLYDRMLLDPQIAASDSLMRASILEDGAQLRPAIDDATADGHDLAAQYVTFCERQIDELETALDVVLWDMLGCLSRGSRVAEITYWPFDQSPLPGRAVLRSLSVKPREATAFVVDAYMRVLGLMARQSDQPAGVLTGVLVNPTDPRVIDREKFAISSFRSTNNDPRGTSTLRPAYTPWWAKMQTWQEFLKYLAQFATPSLVAKLSPNAKVGRDIISGRDIDPALALEQRLALFQNSSILVVGAGTELDLLTSTGEGQAFLNAFALYDQQISRAITTQTLASGEGEYASRAQAGVHQDALDTIIRQAKRAICRMLRRDVLRNLIRYNFGDAAAPLTPYVSLGEVEPQDRPALMSSVAQLERAGYIHESQRPGIDRQLNLPPRMLDAPDDDDQPPTGRAPEESDDQ